MSRNRCHTMRDRALCDIERLQIFSMLVFVLPPGFEPGKAASKAVVISVSPQEQ